MAAKDILRVNRELMMSKDGAPMRPKDASRVALGEGYEVAYWSQKFGVSPEKLKEAVNAVGDFSKAVEDYLDKK